MSNSSFFLKAITGQKARSGVILLFIMFMAPALALFFRQISDLPPLFPADLTAFEFDPYAVGFAVQEVAVPVVLIYILGTTSFFRRVVGGEPEPSDMLKLFGLLAVIQLLSLHYHLILLLPIDEQVTFGVLVVATGGLLGGWPLGLGLGLLTMFVYGTQNLILYPDEDLLFFYETGNLSGLLNPALWGDIFFWNYLTNSEATATVWAGVVAGLGADLLGRRRFSPAPAMGLAMAISLGVGYLSALAWDEPAVLVSFLLPSALVTGLAMAAIVLIVRNAQAEAAQRKAKATELALAQAELRALRAQINPHFLFNTLNTIRYFVRTDPETARLLLLNLSRVFQHALRSGEFVPLQDELNYVEAYLFLEEKRLDDRLHVIWSVQAEAWLDHPVPTLILQPVVENAVIHGIAKKPEGGNVTITIKPANNDLLFQIEDNGLGIEANRLATLLSPEQSDGTSIGLRNIDGRLRALYGEAYRLIIESEVERGTCVQIKIPIEG